MQGTYAK